MYDCGHNDPEHASGKGATQHRVPQRPGRSAGRPRKGKRRTYGVSARARSEGTVDAQRGPWTEIDLISEIFGFTVINRQPEGVGKIGPLPTPKEARIALSIRFSSLWVRPWGTKEGKISLPKVR